ncbi:hypothetical protein [Streptomyces chrestomyceticus]|uniref:MmpS family membrane protein n=1 Tax=Streptomyces chrestomyceticus TaxID=68185 RepID=A0ABU7WMW3_9ACTN
MLASRLRAVAVATACAAVLTSVAACGAVDKAVDKAVDEQIGQDVEKEMKAYEETAYQVTYEVTGGAVDSIAYDDASHEGSVEVPAADGKAPKLPWRKTVTLKGSAAPTVLAVVAEGGGEVTCSVTYQGRHLTKRTAKGGFETAQCVAMSPLK